MADDLNSRSLSLTIFEVGSLVLLNILSLTGNTMICISVYRNTRLRTTTNLFIIALAITDLLSAMFVTPYGIAVLITSQWIFGEVLCQLHFFFSAFVIYVSSVTMGLTALNRYVRICKSDQKYKRLFSTRKSILLLALVWTFVACYVIIPSLAGLQTYKFVPGYATCAPYPHTETWKTINYAILVSLFLIAPLLATIFSYIKVAKKIREHNTAASSSIRSREGSMTTITANEIRVSKSLFTVVFAFMICWIPFWITVILRRFNFLQKMPGSVELMCMCFLYLSNTINPFIYAGMNPAFRGEVCKTLCCWQRRKVGEECTAAKTNIEDAESNVVSRDRACTENPSPEKVEVKVDCHEEAEEQEGEYRKVVKSPKVNGMKQKSKGGGNSFHTTHMDGTV